MHETDIPQLNHLQEALEHLGFRFHSIVSVGGGASEPGRTPQSQDGKLYGTAAEATAAIPQVALQEVNRRKALYKPGEPLPEDLTVEATGQLLTVINLEVGDYYRGHRALRTIKRHGHDDSTHQ